MFAKVVLGIRGDLENCNNIFLRKTHFYVVVQSSPSLYSVLGSTAIYFNLSVKGSVILHLCTSLICIFPYVCVTFEAGYCGHFNCHRVDTTVSKREFSAICD